MERNHTETTNIILADGHRMVVLASIDVEAMRTHNKRTEINRTNRPNADIACIHEKHDAITTASNMEAYIIYISRTSRNKIIEDEEQDTISCN